MIELCHPKMDTPIFCLTSDVDWASEACLEDMFDIVSSFGVVPTFFATHASDTLSRWEREGYAEVGIHPNFLEGSTHGENINEVVDHVLSLYPNARSFRSHCFVDNSHLCTELYKRGIRYDSNLCLYLQDSLVPLRHCSGLIRYPCFFEDDVHWYWNGAWDIDKYIDNFLQPGIKIFNFHPKFVSFNLPDEKSYTSIRTVIPNADKATIEKYRHHGPGPRTFLIELLARLTEMGFKLHTLSDVHSMFSKHMEL